MIRLLSGDCRDVLPTLPAESVQCVVTSPPYYGLRDYGTALWDGGAPDCDHTAKQPKRGNAEYTNGQGGSFASNLQAWGDRDVSTVYRDTCGKCGAVRVDRQIGLEATPDEYLATMVGVFREVRRVLRRDGTCWVNMGDSYASGGSKQTGRSDGGRPERNGGFRNGRWTDGAWTETTYDITRAPAGGCGDAKPKDLLLMPARLALALQADGWWVRSMMPWVKRSAMPESVTDRPASAIEYVLLLTKSARYFWDGDAVKVTASEGTNLGLYSNGHKTQANRDGAGGRPSNFDGYRPSSRNFRNSDLFYSSLEPPFGLICDAAGEPLALDVNPAAFSQAHFATFSAKLVEPLIRCSTSERGCCAACGKPWGRVTQASGGILGKSWHDHSADAVKGNAVPVCIGKSGEEPYQRTTTGWSPGCRCDAGDPVPCTVLDPFAGAGTTLLVADRLQRDAIGIELNTAYTEMAMERCRADAPLFTSFPPAEDPEETRMADLFTDMAAD